MKKALSALLMSMALSTPALADMAADIDVEQPFARDVPPGQPNSAAFMILHNDADTNARIISAESSASNVVELHTHTHDNGVMRMRQIDKIEVPANGQQMLQPGGLHIMLIGLKPNWNQSKLVDLKLNFEDGSTKELTIPVVRPMAHGH